MCGIAGYYNYSNSQIVENSLCEELQETLKHRGPDGHRIWISKNKKIGLIHRRLSILDLSEAGFQPMFNHDNSIVIICNGEIYNHYELRKELENKGYKFKSNSDSETIVYSYEEWGIQCLDRFNGMFAIVIYDQRKNELYLARDRMGIKPLYFSLNNGILSFASEIKALQKLPWITKEINPLGLYHYLTYMVTPAPMTLYSGIYKLPASHYLKIDRAQNISFEQWYTPIKNTISKTLLMDEHWVIETISELLNNSIKHQMMSDVPYGVFLSGGIDSSLNVAMMSQYTDRVNTFTVAFSDGPEYNELAWARKVAQHFNTNHHEIIISEQDAFNFFEKMVYHQDEPLADCVCIPLYYIAKLLKDSGVTVVQVGEGSDELFCGYGTYAEYIDLYERYWKPSQKYIPAIGKQTISSLFSLLFSHKIHHTALLKNWAHNKHFFWSGAIAFPELFKKYFFTPNKVPYHDPVIDQIYPGFSQNYDSYAIIEYHLRKLYEQDPNADFLKSISYLELQQRLPELLLMRVDKMTMANSVEARVPFLDHRIVEFALQIPSPYKYNNGITKYILKKVAEQILPHEIVYRKKMGFAAPITRWFKQGNYFPNFFLEILDAKRYSAEQFLNIDAIKKLLKNNENNEFSVQLWTLQNLIAALP